MTESPLRPIRVMVVDDSAVVRGFIVRALDFDPRIELVGSCGNGEIAVIQAARKAPDVIILDIEMPVMNGLEALPKLLRAVPGVRVVMASTLTQRNAAASLKALSLGASDYIGKPGGHGLAENDVFQRELVAKVLALGAARPLAGRRKSLSVLRGGPMRRPQFIVIGSSTGGPQALLTLLGGLPPSVNCPIAIAQHMPPTFTTVLAQHIARASNRFCVEAAHGLELRPDCIYVAPGDYHLRLAKRDDRIVAQLDQGAPENFCRPSVDPLFRSAAALFGRDSCGVILTGMGSDGCAGARQIAEAGGHIVAQDESTSVVWGMPGAAVAAGICSAILPLPLIAPHLGGLFSREAAA